MYNPIAYRLAPIVFDEQEYMKARIRQEKEFVNTEILKQMDRDSNLLYTLLQQMEITRIEEKRDCSIVFVPTLHIVPAEQVIAERNRVMRPEYNLTASEINRRAKW